MVVGWFGSRLNNKYIASPDVLFDLNGDFSVGELLDCGYAQTSAQVFGYFPGQFLVGAS